MSVAANRFGLWGMLRARRDTGTRSLMAVEYDVLADVLDGALVSAVATAAAAMTSSALVGDGVLLPRTLSRWCSSLCRLLGARADKKAGECGGDSNCCSGTKRPKFALADAAVAAAFLLAVCLLCKLEYQ